MLDNVALISQSGISTARMVCARSLTIVDAGEIRTDFGLERNVLQYVIQVMSSIF